VGSERLRESCSGDVPALTCALPITRNRRQCVDCGPPDHLDDDRGQGPCQASSPSLLPGRHDRARTCVVDERRSRPSERKAPARALRAPADRPGARAATAIAHGWPDADEAVEARIAELEPRSLAGGAAARQREPEHVHAPTVRARVCRDGADFVPGSCPLSRARRLRASRGRRDGTARDPPAP
jgi:hypothetical protein